MPESLGNLTALTDAGPDGNQLTVGARVAGEPDRPYHADLSGNRLDANARFTGGPDRPHHAEPAATMS